MDPVIVNKVAESSLVTINLEDYLPKDEPVFFDLKDYLFMGLIIKEKDFREALKEINWSSYENKTVLITCSADAVIPVWAYMLAASYLQPVANEIFSGTKEEWKKTKLLETLCKTDPALFKDQRIVIKGCGDEPIAEAAYIEITKILRPVAKTIMYGEPCSTVPIFKQPKSTV
jgi:Protein of unknown function (DUF2480)